MGACSETAYFLFLTTQQSNYCPLSFIDEKTADQRVCPTAQGHFTGKAWLALVPRLPSIPLDGRKSPGHPASHLTLILWKFEFLALTPVLKSQDCLLLCYSSRLTASRHFSWAAAAATTAKTGSALGIPLPSWSCTAKPHPPMQVHTPLFFFLFVLCLWLPVSYQWFKGEMEFGRSSKQNSFIKSFPSRRSVVFGSPLLGIHSLFLTRTRTHTLIYIEKNSVYVCTHLCLILKQTQTLVLGRWLSGYMCLPTEFYP